MAGIEAGELAFPVLGEGADVGENEALLALRRAVECSFAPETLVATPFGLASMGTLKVGDLVYARDENTAQVMPEPILHVFSEEHTDDIRVLKVKSGAGQEAEIVTSDRHPFHRSGAGWAMASSLVVGDEVDTLQGGKVVVVATTHIAKPVSMLNFEVRDLHTYAVSRDQVWVHNSLFCDKAKKEAMAAKARAENIAKGIPEKVLGPSGKPKIYVKAHATRKKAQDAAVGRGRRGAAPEEHSNPTVGDPHFHPSGSNSREHHTFPGSGFPKNEDF
jgi:hypothetical protein